MSNRNSIAVVAERTSAFRNKVIGRNYFTLRGEEHDELMALARAWKYRQSAFQRGLGRSRFYSFFLKLTRAERVTA